MSMHERSVDLATLEMVMVNTITVALNLRAMGHKSFQFSTRGNRFEHQVLEYKGFPAKLVIDMESMQVLLKRGEEVVYDSHNPGSAVLPAAKDLAVMLSDELLGVYERLALKHLIK